MSKRYDAIIVGTGIGGLICGSYLAKSGLKILMIEKHTIPGGYCTSFLRNGFSFDVGVHYLGGVRNGILGKILRELGILKDLKLVQYDPVDKIILPENEVRLRACFLDTIEEFKQCFPMQRNNLKRFFSFITQKDFLDIYKKVKNITFQEVLDDFFADYKLKASLNIFLGNIGAPASVASAIASIILFREYLLDPGYYPKGGIQELPNALVSKFKENGGEIIFGTKVFKILTKNNVIKGVVIDKNKTILADRVISNADVTRTFKELLGFRTNESLNVSRLLPTPSMVLVYLGLKAGIRNVLKEGANLYYFSSYDINSAYGNFSKNISNEKIAWVVCSFPSFHNKKIACGKDSMMILTYAPYFSVKFWDKRKKLIADKMIAKASELISGLKDYIEVNISASPITLSRYTFNRDGAFAGWLPTCEQIKPNVMPQVSSIKNLYLVGHWCAVGYLPFGGIPNVAFTGRRAAQNIVETTGKDWKYEVYKKKR